MTKKEEKIYNICSTIIKVLNSDKYADQKAVLFMGIKTHIDFLLINPQYGLGVKLDEYIDCQNVEDKISKIINKIFQSFN